MKHIGDFEVIESKPLSPGCHIQKVLTSWADTKSFYVILYTILGVAVLQECGVDVIGFLISLFQDPSQGLFL
jgi:hypothetical protein